MKRAKAEPNMIQRDMLIAYTIERLRNRGGHWEGDTNARKVLAEMLDMNDRQQRISRGEELPDRKAPEAGKVNNAAGV